MDGQEQMKTIPFLTPDGETVELYVLEDTMLQGIHYILVTEELDQGTEEASAMIMKEETQSGENEFAVYDIVENEEELQALAAVFAEQMEDVDFKL